MTKITCLLLASWLLTACGGEKKPTETNTADTTKAEAASKAKEAIAPRFTKAENTEGAQKLATQNNQFALNFYTKLKNEKAQQGRNMFFSPFSLHTALGMLYVGTTNVGKSELAKVLGVEGAAEVGKDFYNLQGAVLNHISPHAEIALSNALWISDKANTLPAYQKAVQEDFETEIFKGKLDSPEATQQINDWVNKNTRGRIPIIIENDNQPNAFTRLILLNALYFKSTWASGYEFEEANTKEGDFTLVSTAKVKAQMMNRYGGKYNYLETADMQMIAIPYKNYASCLYIILPKATTSLPALEASFTPENIKLWLSTMKHTDAELITIPKVALKTHFPANDILKNMGAKAIFDTIKPIHLLGIDNGADSLFVKSVIHKTFLKINEKGAEAAAITEEKLENPKEEARQPPKKFSFIANRPYMFFIADTNLKTMLFMGRIMNPLEK